MSLFSWLFPKTSVNRATGDYFKTLTAYRPCFKSFSGGIYEADLCRSAIHAVATQASKLNLEEVGSTKLHALLQRPNVLQTSSQFLYQLITNLECENTAFIFPKLDAIGDRVLEIYAVNPSSATIKEYGGRLYLEARFGSGQCGIVEYERVGVLTKFQYKDIFFGSPNTILSPTLEVLHTQNQGIVEGVKNSAAIRFLARLSSVFNDDTIEEERARFASFNLSSSNTSQVMMFDGKYSDVKQIESKPFIVDADQRALIENNIMKYFGISSKILDNSFDEDGWNAFYEGRVEPLAIQLSQVLTRMLYTQREQELGHYIIASANRLQYASNNTKLNIVTQLMDRGILTANEGREIFNMPGFGAEGDKRYIRLEYTEIDNLNAQSSEAQGDETSGAEED